MAQSRNKQCSHPETSSSAHLSLQTPTVSLRHAPTDLTKPQFPPLLGEQRKVERTPQVPPGIVLKQKAELRCPMTAGSFNPCRGFSVKLLWGVCSQLTLLFLQLPPVFLSLADPRPRRSFLESCTNVSPPHNPAVFPMPRTAGDRSHTSAPSPAWSVPALLWQFYSNRQCANSDTKIKI